VASSQLHSLGCPELVAHTRQDYVAIASKLGSDPNFLDGMKTKVWAARTSSPLFNTQIYAHNLEDLFERMWELHEVGQPPQPLTKPWGQPNGH